MFGKKKFEEAPLGYWEEKSYFMLIPGNGIPETNEISERVSGVEGINVLKNNFDEKSGVFFIDVKYDNEEFQLGFYPGGFSLPEVYLNSFFHFSDDEIEKIKSASTSLTFFMEFGKDIKKSYHLQLKISAAVMPDMLVLVDESAERLLPAKWAVLAAQSKVTPGPNDIYNVHAVIDDGGEVWLHTHGLCRCGLTELEILQSSKENYNNHYNLISTLACYIIDKNGSFDPRKESAFIGILTNRNPVVAICKSWTEAIGEYKKLKMGGAADRADAHNTRTSPIFLYKTEADEKRKKISKVTDYDKLWGENPIFFFSNEETARMKALAMERFDYLKKAMEDKENKALVKIGLLVDGGNDDNYDYEHIWFELLEFDGDRFKGKLTQEPYNIKDLHTGDERWFTVENVTDWQLYTPKCTVNPGNVYLLFA